MKDVVAPPHGYLQFDRVFTSSDGKPDVDMVKTYIFEGGRLSKDLLMKLMEKVKQRYMKEANMVRVDGKAFIIGDIHGQFYDLAEMLRTIPKPGHKGAKILFLGDYVDRGNYGPEVAAYLFTLKLAYPNDVFMLRGNHESRDMAESFNFRYQVLDLYDEEVYETYMEVFDSLPVAAHVNGQYLCVHGGISPKLATLD